MTKSFDLSQDEIGVRRPHERFGVLVALVQVGKHGFLELPDRRVASPSYTSLRHFREQPLDQIQPASAGRREVHMISGVPCEPVSHFAYLVGAVVVHHEMDVEPARKIGLDIV